MRFEEGLGCTRDECQVQSLPSTKKLVDEYFDITRSSYASGLGALYAYERQTPSVAKSKIEGLEKFYGINDTKTLKFLKCIWKLMNGIRKNVHDYLINLVMKIKRKLA